MGEDIIDFVKVNYFVIVYGITWLISVFTYKKYFDTLLKYFPIIIAYTFFTELLGGLVANYDDFQLIFGYNQTNYRSVIYNIYHLCFFLFFFFVYWKLISNKTHKIAIKYGSYAFVFINIINCFIKDPIIFSLVYAYIFGILLLIYCILVYLKKILKEYNINLLKYNLMFWVSIGLLLFHATYLPLKIVKEFYPESYYIAFRHLHLGMIVLMYVIFSIGFIMSKRKAFR
ncbi:hypothetical protein [uncultured Croceitalea sp.]|uniref:hypothetical protein n=1 Tax=uncultured Croceitalea sp. TaxID=1798908 RepID=UPI003305C87B